MNTQPTTNTHFSSQHRLGVQPNMSDVTSMFKSYNPLLTQQRDLERYTPALSSKTLIFDQSRVTEPLNYYGTRYIRYVDPTVKYHPAGMDGRNSTRATGEAFTKPMQKHYPQNVSFILG